MINVGKIIKQGDEPHGSLILGDGPRTIGQAGCLLSCFTMCARALLGQPLLALYDVHAIAKQHDAFIGSGLRLDKLAEAFSLRPVERERFDLQRLILALSAGQPIILGIDYKPGRSSGFSDADHFIVATGYEGSIPIIYTANPATGLASNIEVTKPHYRGWPCAIAEMITFKA